MRELFYSSKGLQEIDEMFLSFLRTKDAKNDTDFSLLLEVARQFTLNSHEAGQSTKYSWKSAPSTQEYLQKERKDWSEFGAFCPSDDSRRALLERAIVRNGESIELQSSLLIALAKITEQFLVNLFRERFQVDFNNFNSKILNFKIPDNDATSDLAKSVFSFSSRGHPSNDCEYAFLFSNQETMASDLDPDSFDSLSEIAIFYKNYIIKNFTKIDITLYEKNDIKKIIEILKKYGLDLSQRIQNFESFFVGWFKENFTQQDRDNCLSIDFIKKSNFNINNRNLGDSNIETDDICIDLSSAIDILIYWMIYRKDECAAFGLQHYDSQLFSIPLKIPSSYLERMKVSASQLAVQENVVIDIGDIGHNDAGRKDVADNITYICNDKLRITQPWSTDQSTELSLMPMLISDKGSEYYQLPPRTPLSALCNSRYCLYCHARQKDSCRFGFQAAQRNQNVEISVDVKDIKKETNIKDISIKDINILSSTEQNHKASINPPFGCPLRERISEMHALYSDGHPIAALLVAMVDNPLLPVTGHRICNDCSRSCIFSKQTPVDTPLVETSILDQVLGLQFGFEIYSLLTRWNPLLLSRRVNIAQQLEVESCQYRVLVVGMGPAGFALAYYLLQSGAVVVGIDGNHIEPLPSELSGIKICGARTEFRMIENVQEIYDICPEIAGFGGVMAYGITDRWQKKYLHIIRLVLERNPHFRMYGGVFFGGNIGYLDAMQLSFDHIAFAAGAGESKRLPNIKNITAGNVRFASDFLMSLHLNHLRSFRSSGVFFLQLPIAVIGGGLTAIDSAVEAIKQYIFQALKYFIIDYILLKGIFTKSSKTTDVLREYLSVNIEQTKSLAEQELIEHGGAMYSLAREYKLLPTLEELENLIYINNIITVDKLIRNLYHSIDFIQRAIKFIRQKGGVTIYYRDILAHSSAYKINPDELYIAFREGIAFVENTTLQEVLVNESGNCCAAIFSNNKQIIKEKCCTILIAIGTEQNSEIQRTIFDEVKRDIVQHVKNERFDLSFSEIVEEVLGQKKQAGIMVSDFQKSCYDYMEIFHSKNAFVWDINLSYCYSLIKSHYLARSSQDYLSLNQLPLDQRSLDHSSFYRDQFYDDQIKKNYAKFFILLSKLARQYAPISHFGDMNPQYSGSVVKAIASAKYGASFVIRSIKERNIQSVNNFSYNFSDVNEFFEKIDHIFLAKILDITSLSKDIYVIRVFAPYLAKKALPSQFFKLQPYSNLETSFSIRSNKFSPRSFYIEPIALTCSKISDDELEFAVVECGASSFLLRLLKVGEYVSLSGPLGQGATNANCIISQTDISTANDISTDKGRVLLIGSGTGNCSLLPVAEQYQSLGLEVIWVAGYRKFDDITEIEKMLQFSNILIITCEQAQNNERIQNNSCLLLSPKNKDQYHHYIIVSGTVIDGLDYFLHNPESKLVITEIANIKCLNNIIDDIMQIFVIGSSNMMNAVNKWLSASLPYNIYRDRCVASINAPMQCMMRGVCGQCVQKISNSDQAKINPEYLDFDDMKISINNGNNKNITSVNINTEVNLDIKLDFVYACKTQNLPFALVDFGNLKTRLQQNNLLEKQTYMFIKHYSMLYYNFIMKEV